MEILKHGVAVERLRLSRKEQQWLARIETALDELLTEEVALVVALEEQNGSLYDEASYTS